MEVDVINITISKNPIITYWIIKYTYKLTQKQINLQYVNYLMF